MCCYPPAELSINVEKQVSRLVKTVSHMFSLHVHSMVPLQLLCVSGVAWQCEDNDITNGFHFGFSYSTGVLDFPWLNIISSSKHAVTKSLVSEVGNMSRVWRGALAHVGIPHCCSTKPWKPNSPSASVSDPESSMTRTKLFQISK